MAKNIFFKRIPRTQPGIRVILIQNKYYWIVPKHMHISFNEVNGRYILRYELRGKTHAKSTTNPSIKWIIETAKEMSIILHKAGKLYQVGVPESIAVNRHPEHPCHYFNTPTLVRKFCNESRRIYSPSSRDQKEIDLFLSRLEKKRDDLLTELKDLARITPDEAVTLYTEDPTDALVTKWKEHYGQ